MTRSREAKLRRTSFRRIPFEPGIDAIGPCIGICPYHAHKQIVGNGLLKECLEKTCYYLSMFRPEGTAIKEGILLQVFIVPNKDFYKTEIQRKKAESALQFAGGIIEKAVYQYTLRLMEEDKTRYDVSIQKIYPKKHPYLKGCPLENYPKAKKEKKERDGRKKSI